MLLIMFSKNIVNYMTFGTWLNYMKLFFAISPTGPLADRSLVVVVVVPHTLIETLSVFGSFLVFASPNV